MAYTKITVDGARCDICGVESCAPLHRVDGGGWEWRTGYNPPTKHACVKCKGSDQWKEVVRKADTPIVKGGQEK